MSHPEPRLDSRLRENDERGENDEGGKRANGGNEQVGKGRSGLVCSALDSSLRCAPFRMTTCCASDGLTMELCKGSQLAGLAFSRGFLALGLAPLLSTRPAFCRQRLQVLAGVGVGHLGYLLRGAFGYYVASLLACSGTQVYDPVGVLDHVQVVLYQDYRIARIHQPVQYSQQGVAVQE